MGGVSDPFAQVRAHKARYKWAADVLHRELGSMPGRTVIDAGCGDGYGAEMLAQRGFRVLAIDNDPAALKKAGAFRSHPGIRYRCADLDYGIQDEGFDAIVAFGLIEHLCDVEEFLIWTRQAARVFVGCVPNRSVASVPERLGDFNPYSETDLREQLTGIGWHVTWVGGQWADAGREALVYPGDLISAEWLVFHATAEADSAWPA